MTADHAWYAIRVRSRFEQVASAVLRSRGYEEFHPTIRTERRWSDRTKRIEVPLFPGYIFCRFDARHRVPILESTGVAGIVEFDRGPAAIPDREIESLRTVVGSSLTIEPYTFLAPGRRIRIEGGPLAGVEGIVVQWKNRFRVVVSVTLLQRSVCVEIDREWTCPLDRTEAPLAARSGSEVRA